MTTAIGTMRQRGRAAIVEPDTSCWTIDTENCRIKIEMALELRGAGNPWLADQVVHIGRDCSDEAQFEGKYGLAAFRDHRKLLEKAEKDAADEALADAWINVIHRTTADKVVQRLRGSHAIPWYISQYESVMGIPVSKDDFGGLMEGKWRLQELQQPGSMDFADCGDTLYLVFKSNPVGVSVTFNQDPIGEWTTDKKGVMVAQFEGSEAFSTTDVAQARQHTLNMGKEHRRRMARRA